MGIHFAFNHATMCKSLETDLIAGRSDHVLNIGAPWWDERVRMEAGSLITLGGATNHGKSSTAIAYAMKAAANGIGVTYVSLEDKFRMMSARIIGWQAGISPRRLRRGELRDEERRWVTAGGLTNLKHLDLTCRTDLRRVEDIVAVYEEAKECGHKLVVIDYLQAINVGIGDKRTLIGDAAQRIRDTGDRCGIATLLLSQVRRRQSEDERPTLSMLKEAGEIENASDAVVFVWKDKETGDVDVWVEKGKDDFNATPWRMRRNQSWGGLLVEVSRGGFSAETDNNRPWERDDDQNDSEHRPEVQRRQHEQGSGGEPQRPDAGATPANGAGPYPQGWANRHDVR